MDRDVAGFIISSSIMCVDCTLAHTSVLSPDAGRLASGVSKGPLVREIHRLPVPQGRPTSVPSPASYVIRGGTAGSPRECGGPSNRGPRVMPTLMPIGSQNQSVGVGPLGRSVFRRRSQTGPVRLRTLSGNAVYGKLVSRVRIPLAPDSHCNTRSLGLPNERDNRAHPRLWPNRGPTAQAVDQPNRGQKCMPL